MLCKSATAFCACWHSTNSPAAIALLHGKVSLPAAPQNHINGQAETPSDTHTKNPASSSQCYVQARTKLHHGRWAPEGGIRGLQKLLRLVTFL